MYCSKSQFTELNFLGKQNTPNDVRGLCKHYHIRFYPKIGHGTCTIRIISCAFMKYTSTLDKICTSAVPPHQQPYYQTVKYLTYCTVLGSFHNCNVIHFSDKVASSEDIDKIHHVALYSISDNMG